MIRGSNCVYFFRQNAVSIEKELASSKDAIFLKCTQKRTQENIAYILYILITRIFISSELLCNFSDETNRSKTNIRYS